MTEEEEDQQLKKAHKKKWDMKDFFASRRLASIFAEICDLSKIDNNVTYMALLLMLWKVAQEHKEQMPFEEFRAHVFEDFGNMNKNLRQPNPEEKHHVC